MTRPTDPTLYPALYQAVEALHKPILSASSSYLDIEQLIKQGAPLNPPSSAYHSLIGPIVMAMTNHGERVHPHVDLLVGAGMNPMLCGGFTAKLVDNDEETADHLLRAMFRAEEAGFAMRNEQGEGPLHALMQSFEWQCSLNSPQWMRERYHRAWVNAERHDGCTPLHDLWAPMRMRLSTYQGIPVARAWEETQALVQYGANLNHRSATGIDTPAQVITHCVEGGILVHPSGQATYDLARTLVAQETLDAATPRAVASSPGRRI